MGGRLWGRVRSGSAGMAERMEGLQVGPGPFVPSALGQPSPAWVSIGPTTTVARLIEHLYNFRGSEDRILGGPVRDVP